ncbi:MAG: hypothetical protein AAFS11_00185 [Planctomycetota bacterium]
MSVRSYYTSEGRQSMGFPALQDIDLEAPFAPGTTRSTFEFDGAVFPDVSYADITIADLSETERHLTITIQPDAVYSFDGFIPLMDLGGGDGGADKFAMTIGGDFGLANPATPYFDADLINVMSLSATAFDANGVAFPGSVVASQAQYPSGIGFEVQMFLQDPDGTRPTLPRGSIFEVTLNVTYMIPAPATASLLGVAGLAATRRRR